MQKLWRMKKLTRSCSPALLYIHVIPHHERYQYANYKSFLCIPQSRLHYQDCPAQSKGQDNASVTQTLSLWDSRRNWGHATFPAPGTHIMSPCFMSIINFNIKSLSRECFINIKVLTDTAPLRVTQKSLKLLTLPRGMSASSWKKL